MWVLGQLQTSSPWRTPGDSSLFCEEGSCRVCAQSPVKYLALHKPHSIICLGTQASQVLESTGIAL